MASIVGSYLNAVKPLLDFFPDAFDSDLHMEDVQNMPDRDSAGVFQAFFIERGIDLVSFEEMLLQDLVCMLQAAVTAVTHRHDIQMLFFSERQVSCRRKEIGPVAEVLERISATAKLFDVNNLHTERPEHGVRGGLILLEINRCAATAL
jgi:hypothetical protein